MPEKKSHRHGGGFKKTVLLFLSIAMLFFFFWKVNSLLNEYFGKENRYDKTIRNIAKRYCIDSRLLKAVIWRESRFNSGARGNKGEIGLMQLMRKASVQDWANYYNVELPCEGVLYNPELNIEIGAWYLSRALRKWQDFGHAEELALCEYNAGRKMADKWKPDNKSEDMTDRIKIDSTRDYVEKIMEKYSEYCNKKR
ncbi:MAG: hypothetical protein A2017_03470 [Lentisphaerae bacterium GWF2_44_16]|nr:MAG: hypothetical protein A2017_03470 [Lentisphaerae bacterium GWF2_44_16]